jgi:hypothetical protein
VLIFEVEINYHVYVFEDEEPEIVKIA